MTHRVEVHVGDETRTIETTGDSFRGPARIPSFADMLADCINATEKRIRNMESDITFLQGKIDSWVKVAG